MKQILLFCPLIFLLHWTSYAQGVDLNGSWHGALDVSGQKLPLVFNFEGEGEEWKGSLDSPAQGAKGIPVKKVLFNGTMLSVEIATIYAVYEGVLVGESIKGNFTQSGQVFPLELEKKEKDSNETSVPKPQEPRPPFNYEQIATSFSNKEEGIVLHGTITKPEGNGPFPSVVLITGSGPQNRDGELLGHKPFWVMADYLTKSGIAVFRYDERGVGESEGDFAGASSLDFKKDAALAMEHLKKYPFVNQLKTGFIGHSEGGLITWLLGAEKPGTGFIIALAPPAVPIHELMKQQTRDLLEATGAPQELVDQQTGLNTMIYETFRNTDHWEDIQSNLENNLLEFLDDNDIIDSLSENQKESLLGAYENMLTPWFYTFIRMDPQSSIASLELPVLALFGGKDLQVNADKNAQALNKIIGENNRENFLVKVYPGLNHLFQTAETGNVSEYATITETFNEEVLEDMVDWIKQLP